MLLTVVHWRGRLSLAATDFRRVRCFLSFEPSGRPGFRFWGRSPDCITPRWLKQAPGAVRGQRGGQAMSSERHGQDKGG